MIRDSSAAAFRALHESGGITPKQLTVLIYIFQHQDDPKPGEMLTRADVEVANGDLTQTLGPRFVELERAKLLYIAGKRPNCRTGRPVQAWRVPTTFDDQVQAKRPKQLSATAALKQLIQEVDAAQRDIRQTPLLAVQALKAALERARSREALPKETDEAKS